MIKKVKILECVDIINDSIKPYKNKRSYLDTGGLKLDIIKETKDYSFIDKPSRANQNVQVGDIILARMQSTIKVKIIGETEKDLMISTGFLVLRPNKSKVDSKYIYHVLLSSSFQNEKDKLCSGSTQKAINNSNFKKLSIPLPSLEEQKKIAAILDAADDNMQKTKALIDKYDQLTQSLFLDMIGDPVTNPKGLNYSSLSNHGDFKNGLNYSKGDSGFTLKYLGVGDFKKKYRLDDIDSLDYINVNVMPQDGYLLNNGDLVFVRSNGNKALVGRCIEVFPNDVNLTFSGFCIRFRVHSDEVSSSYLAHLFRVNSFKSSMLQKGRGANIQNINQKILSELQIPIPPIELQNQFAERVEQIEKQKQQAEASLVKAEELYNSLLQRAFKGELTN